METFKAPRVLSVSELKTISKTVNNVFKGMLGVDKFVKYGSLERDEYGVKVNEGWVCEGDDCRWTYNFIDMDVSKNRSFYKACERVACLLDAYFGFKWDYAIQEMYEYEDHVGTYLIFEPMENIKAREEYRKIAKAAMREAAARNAARSAERSAVANTILGDIEALAELRNALGR